MKNMIAAFIIAAAEALTKKATQAGALLPLTGDENHVALWVVIIVVVIVIIAVLAAVMVKRKKNSDESDE